MYFFSYSRQAAVLFSILLLRFSVMLGGGIGNGSDGSPNISGVINTYTSVLSVSSASCSSSITVFSAAGFSVGDLVLIMQMEGAAVNTSNSAAYGGITGYNGAGQFEYARVFSVAGNVIQTVAPLSNTYNILGVVQLIRVPQYANPVITGTLTAQAWNGLTGGVLVLDASGTITFNADINVSGLGFRGGQYQPGADFHLHVDDYTALSYPDSFSLKGEGIATYGIAPYASGRGAAANGGGGGNNHNAGGGGGSNAGCGGNGGYGFSDTSLYGTNYAAAQGIGGYVLSSAGVPSRIFMGGGGGAGNADNGSNASGANGGGIVLISTSDVNGNGRFVFVNGANAPATVLDGSGGGGAGGSIMIDCSAINSVLNISGTGGNGGNGTSVPYDPHGPGGGGGGGLLAVTSALLPANLVINSLNGGAAGLCDGLNHGTTPGCAGTTLYNFSYPVQVNNPTVTSFSDTTFCNNGTLSLLCSPGNTFSWSPAAGLSCTNCQNPVATVNASVTYVATVTISSCIYIDSFQVTIHPLPVVNLTTPSAVCADADTFILNGGTPAGGVYSGWGVNAGYFDPSLSGTGSGTILYSWTDSNGCVNSDSSVITVHPLPVVTFAAISPLCISAPPFMLTGGTPSGGVYAGPGVTAGVFDPQAAGAGNHTLTYSYTDGNGCRSSDSITITVYALPVVSLPPISSVCDGSPSFLLTGATPSGGVYTGIGVSGSSFDASVAGPGNHTVAYTVTDTNGCISSDSVQVLVHALPNVTLSSFTDVCLNSPSFGLAGGLPVGGIYSGNGVTAGQFDPLAAGTGVTIITYSFTDGNGCSDSASQAINVDTLPVITWNALSPLCISAPPFALTIANPTGGLYSGTGVSGGNFNPSTAGSGNHPIQYVYTDLQGCSVADSFIITVYDLPVVNQPPINAVCDGSPAFNLTGASPSGGIYSGPGMTGSQLDPAVAGPGVHTIVYSYTDSNSCLNSDTSFFTVFSLPAVQLNLMPPVCEGQPAFQLSGGSPAGGTYIGLNITAGSFSPSLAGAYTITYSYTDVNGCMDSASQIQVVNSLPVVSLPAISPVCIASAAFPLTAGSPSGGTYSGPGVSAGVFDPAVAGLGTHLIHYAFTDPNGCSNQDSTTITVYDLPVITMPVVSPVCEGTPAFSLSGVNPAGGVYSGNGISGNNFDPGMAGTGTHVITYAYTDVNGCSNTGNMNITVNALPNVTLSSFTPVCLDASPFALAGGSPAGGSYSGAGVSAGLFAPGQAGSGMHAIQYAYTDANGCSNSDTKNITVNALPVVTLSAISPVCIASAAFPLTAGSPSGGTYSGPGISAGVFDPAVAGLGTHLIHYAFTDPNGCSNQDSTTIIEYDLPVVTLSSFGTLCLDAAPIPLTGGLPAGGTYSGPGVINNVFNPSVAGTGNKTIAYLYTDPNGCSNSDSTGLLVNPLPVVSLNLNFQLCEFDSAVQLTGGTPSGGLYSGSNVSGGYFNPNFAGPGVHTVTFSYTDANGCTGNDTSTLTVNPMIYLQAGPDDTLCTGYSLQLSGSGASVLNWSPATGLSCTACPNPVVSTVATAAYVLSSSAACSVSDTLTIQVIPAVSVQAGPDTVLCYGSSIQLSAVSNAPDMTWTPVVSLSCEDCPDPVATPLAPTSYTVTVTNGSCSAADTVTIRVVHPEVDAGPDQEIMLGESLQLSATGCSQYSWSPGQLLNDSLSSSPVATPEATTVFTVLGMLEGCPDSDTIVVHVIDIGDAIFVPNAFTPNNDGRNDFFGPVRQGRFEDFEMIIYNRWGQRIFESSSISNGWNGTFNGQSQPEDTYIYYIRLRISGQPVMKTGRVSLIR